MNRIAKHTLLLNGTQYAKNEQEKLSILIVNFSILSGVVVSLIPIALYLFIDSISLLVSGALSLILMLSLYYLVSKGKWANAVVGNFIFAIFAFPIMLYFIGFSGASFYLLPAGVVVSIYTYTKPKLHKITIFFAMLAILATLAIILFKYDGLEMLPVSNRFMVVINVIISALFLFGLAAYVNTRYLKQEQSLSDLNNVKSELLAVLSHDLRSPINNIKSLISLFKSDDLGPGELQSLIKDMEAQVDSTSIMLNDILLWTKNQQEGINLMVEEFKLKELVDVTITALQPQIDQKKITVTNTLNNDIELFADKEMIKLVVRNIISNSVKFVPQHEGKITIRASILDQLVKLEVEDNGIGLTDELILQLENDEQHSRLGTLNEKGFGMGLSLSMDFIKRHQGNMTFKNAKNGKGACIGFTIPSN